MFIIVVVVVVFGIAVVVIVIVAAFDIILVISVVIVIVITVVLVVYCISLLLLHYPFCSLRAWTCPPTEADLAGGCPPIDHKLELIMVVRSSLPRAQGRVVT